MVCRYHAALLVCTASCFLSGKTDYVAAGLESQTFLICCCLHVSFTATSCTVSFLSHAICSSVLCTIRLAAESFVFTSQPALQLARTSLRVPSSSSATLRHAYLQRSRIRTLAMEVNSPQKSKLKEFVVNELNPIEKPLQFTLAAGLGLGTLFSMMFATQMLAVAVVLPVVALATLLLVQTAFVGFASMGVLGIFTLALAPAIGPLVFLGCVTSVWAWQYRNSAAERLLQEEAGASSTNYSSTTSSSSSSGVADAEIVEPAGPTAEELAAAAVLQDLADFDSRLGVGVLADEQPQPGTVVRVGVI
jgi:hypothetical protein